MRRYSLFATIICLMLIVFSSCNHLPDHARYIPKDASIVVGINMKGIEKKVAWDSFVGSKLFDKIEKNSPLKSILSDAENSGISSSTPYLYVKSDKGLGEGGVITALIPLDNAGKWEAYMKKIFPSATLKQVSGRKEALLPYNMYAGWNDKLLIVIYSLPSASNYQSMAMAAMANNATGGDSSSAAAPQSKSMDETTMAAEMENAFNVSRENSLIENKRFTELESAGHDITSWVNYDILLSKTMQQMSGATGGLTLASTLWKDASAASYYDFEDGAIKGNVHYYMSDDLKDICKELGATNADKDMINRLPVQNLDLLMAWHLSPKGLKALLEKIGVLGFVNVALTSQNMNADSILNAFTGDMAIVVDNFALNNQSSQPTDSMGNTNSFRPSLDAMYVIKINKKESFNKLLQLLISSGGGGLTPMGNNTYMVPITSTDSIFIMTDDNYAIISNKSVVASNFLKGTYKGQKLPSEADIYGHPCGVFIDVQQIVGTINPGITHSAHDSTMIAEGKKLVSSMGMSGGAYKDGAFEYNMSVNFVDKKENSLLQIMDFAVRMNTGNQ